MFDIAARPFTAKNPTQFWQWCNPVVERFLLKFIYRPLKAPLKRHLAMAATFAVSGFGHDLLVGMPLWLTTGDIMFPVITLMFIITSAIVSLCEFVRLDLSERSLMLRAFFHGLCLLGALSAALGLAFVL